MLSRNKDLKLPTLLKQERESLRLRAAHDGDSDEGCDDDTVVFLDDIDEAGVRDETYEKPASPTAITSESGIDVSSTLYATPRSPTPVVDVSDDEEVHESDSTTTESPTGSPKPKWIRTDGYDADEQRTKRQTVKTKKEPKAVIQTVVDFSVVWDESQEDIVIEETPIWLDRPDQPPITLDELSLGMKTAKRHATLDEATTSTTYCQADVHSALTERKERLWTEHDDDRLRRARARANPFETIAGAGFQNRAAMKMANIDSVFNRAISNAKCVDILGRMSSVPTVAEVNESTTASPSPASERLYYFADICAGPGGFSEYMLWRRSYSCRGFGFTLKGKDDFRLENFRASSAEFFTAHYGARDDGDITKTENMTSFADYVVQNSEKLGVHVCMADGGFSVVGHEQLQEVLSKQIYLCQFIVGLSVLRRGGTFVCKLFDTFTAFSVGLIYLMSRAFERICIHKPNTSRPANAERYLVCTGYRYSMINPARHALIRYLSVVNDQMNAMQATWSNGPRSPTADDDDRDVQHIVKPQKIEEDKEFFDYIQATNNRFAHRQYIYLCKYDAYARNPNLQCSLGQSCLRATCLDYWNIPQNMSRISGMKGIAPKMTFSMIMQSSEVPDTWLRSKIDLTDLSQLHTVANNCAPLNYRFYPMTTPNFVVVIGLGNDKSYVCDDCETWQRLDGCNLPAQTLCIAQFTNVRTIQKSAESSTCVNKQPCLLLFDAYILDGHPVHHLPIDIRTASITRLLSALGDRNTLSSPIRIISANVQRLSKLPADVAKFKLSLAGTRVSYVVREAEEGRFDCIPCCGVGVVRATDGEWVSAWSSSSKAPYVFHTSSGQTMLDKQSGSATAYCDLADSMARRMVWSWKNLRDIATVTSKEGYKENEQHLQSMHQLCADVTTAMRKSKMSG